MLPFKLIYSDDYYLPIGQHVFPAQKYRLVHQHLLESGTAAAGDFLTPQPATDEGIFLIPTPGFRNKPKNGKPSPPWEKEIPIPSSPEFVRAVSLSAGGSRLPVAAR